MSLADRLLATPLLDRMPRLKAWVRRNPRLASGLVVVLVLRWVAVPLALLWLAVAEGWLR